MAAGTWAQVGAEREEGEKSPTDVGLEEGAAHTGPLFPRVHALPQGHGPTEPPWGFAQSICILQKADCKPKPDSIPSPPTQRILPTIPWADLWGSPYVG